MKIKFHRLPFFWTDFNILATDYDNYAIIYACKNALWDYYRKEHVFILSRMALDPRKPEDRLELKSLQEVAYDKLRTHVPGAGGRIVMFPVFQSSKTCKYPEYVS